MKRAISAMLALAATCSSTLAVSASMPTVDYTVFGHTLPLQVKSEAIAITWNPTEANAYQMPDDLEDFVRSHNLIIQSTGQHHAILTALSGPLTDTSLNALRNHSQVASVQSVLHSPWATGTAKPSATSTLLLTDELIVQVDPSLSATALEVKLQRVGLELVRPLRFAESQYVVRSRSQHGPELLNTAQRLRQFSGIISAEPNMMQASVATVNLPSASQPVEISRLPHTKPNADTSLQQTAWHLDSRHYRGNRLPRTDIHATEAWEISNRGAGVNVAVIDSTIQWDHPDLINQLACPNISADTALPDETCGYDFVEADGDTRLSEAEIEILKPKFQDSFRLSDQQLLANYPGLVQMLGDMRSSEKARIIRGYLRYQVEVNFHGTWTAGVITANSPGDGLIGVAPDAKILPVRVFDLAGFTSTERLIEATGYAAARGVDVINLSLGSLIPSEAFTHHLFDLLDRYPNLVIVASAGNSNLDGVGFPAAIPGVLSVGATTLDGERASYSTYGGQLDIVAPGGDLWLGARGGILTTGGTWLPELWEGLSIPQSAWGYGVDPLGKYVRVEGTSFAAPNVAGVVALMRGEDVGSRLSREELLERLLATASHEALSLSESDHKHYRLQKELGFGTVFDIPFVRRSGIYEPSAPIDAEQYYFGAGVVNALQAVESVQKKF
ncbi:peptidase S8 [Leptolyngbyaceae cyanobacterium CCMR0082]|uniref:Peptidase S8 n=1 Tax=Adonisia turfae CCMR0082 TaxID=2304604 RepID=A0A6M0SK71_9CYAN|nr:S8 family serine peptidase [Adonisia turfae]NEZ68293.1 peptidase S8 [Adonisia turfae CCMR0082]